jgi:hypothetical protein
VKKLAFMRSMSKMDQVIEILKACPGICILTFWHIETRESSYLTLQKELHNLARSSPSGVPFSNLRQLSLKCPIFPKGQRHFVHPIFRELTHLEAFEGFWFDGGGWSWKTGLRNLKHLTHLRAPAPLVGPGQSLQERIEKILELCPSSLQVLIVWIAHLSRGGGVPANELEAFKMGDIDSRVVLAHTEDNTFGEDSTGYALFYPYEDRVRDWSGVELDGLWRRAEELIERRRSRLQGE